MTEENEPLGKQVLRIETRCKKYEKIIRDQNAKINNLQLELQYTRFKSLLFSKIITENTSIKLDDLLQEKENEVQLINFENGNIPIIVRDLSRETKYAIGIKKINKKKTSPEEQNPKISPKPVEKKQEIDLSELTVLEIIQNVNQLFDEIQKNRFYKKFLGTLKQYNTLL